jgi:hypothetical protein
MASDKSLKEKHLRLNLLFQLTNYCISKYKNL